jgi:hypothetical protein
MHGHNYNWVRVDPDCVNHLDWMWVSALSRWNTNAACREHDPDMWFPTDARDVFVPVSICVTQCTVRQSCLDYAIETKQRYGIWGGIPLDGVSAGRLPTAGPVEVPADMSGTG